MLILVLVTTIGWDVIFSLDSGFFCHGNAREALDLFQAYAMCPALNSDCCHIEAA